MRTRSDRSVYGYDDFHLVETVNNDDAALICGHCNVNVSCVEGIQCEACSCWFHFRCSALSERECRLHENNRDLYWVCAHCNDDQSDSTLELPPFQSLKSADNVAWGKLRGSSITSALEEAHSEIVKWKANLFPTPSDSVG